MYRFFDLCIESELDLPGVPACEGAAPDWTVTRLEASRARDSALEPFHSWTAPDGAVLMTAARQGSCYVLGFPGLARFTIDFNERRVGALPLGDCAPETLAHLLLDQALPRAVCHEGRMVIHASAVQLADGTALAFTGESGRGKSTLAAAFYRAGHALLSDDCLLLENRAGTVHAIPAYPSMRLWTDSAELLLSDVPSGMLDVSRMAHYSRKRVLRPTSAAETNLTAATPLRALILLALPPAHAKDTAVRIEPIDGMAAVMTLVEGQFALDLVDREAIRRGFAAVSDVVGHTPVLRLLYRRDFKALPEVLDKILKST